MKKYKEWLTNEIEIMESETSENYPHEQMVEREVVLNLIDQLDEPEVLSEEWVDSNSVNASHDGVTEEYVHVIDLKNLIIPKQESEVTLNRAFEKVSETYPMTKEEVYRHLEKFVAHGGRVTYGEPEVLSHELPVLPKYVAEWIEHCKANDLDLYEAFGHSDMSVEVSDLVGDMDADILARAWLDGYEVEDEPLYHALIKGHDVSGDYYVYWNCDKFNNDVIVSRLHPPHDDFSTELSKSEWNELGINDSNADFVKVGEVK